VTVLAFPPDFLWGAATSAHQTEGGNSNSDWWDWERAPGTSVPEPSGAAVEHYSRYPEDLAAMAAMGLNTYRFSVEWARVEPAEGTIDEDEIRHYRDVADRARSLGITPMVTLNHFSLPRWVAAQGGWTSERTARLFERYVRRVVAGLGDAVDWYCTINEPATVATGGYVGRWGFPPGVVDVRRWKEAIAGLIDGHVRARDAIHDVRPEARAGLAVFSSERVANAGGRVADEFARYWNEDVYLEAAAEDDFIGVQTYTRQMLTLPRIAAPLTGLALAIRPIENVVVPRVLGMQDRLTGARAYRVTQMGWEYRPESVAAVVRRIAGIYPDKDLVVTEHGVATLDDADRIEFIARGVVALHDALVEGIRLRGYIHWSLLDNYEWATGYRANFGLVGVDRATQERTVRASGRFLGEIARAGCLDPAEIPFRSAGT
jgi:beta-glucosidase